MMEQFIILILVLLLFTVSAYVILLLVFDKLWNNTINTISEN